MPYSLNSSVVNLSDLQSNIANYLDIDRLSFLNCSGRADTCGLWDDNDGLGSEQHSNDDDDTSSVGAETLTDGTVTLFATIEGASRVEDMSRCTAHCDRTSIASSVEEQATDVQKQRIRYPRGRLMRRLGTDSRCTQRSAFTTTATTTTETEGSRRTSGSSVTRLSESMCTSGGRDTVSTNTFELSRSNSIVPSVDSVSSAGDDTLDSLSGSLSRELASSPWPSSYDTASIVTYSSDASDADTQTETLGSKVDSSVAEETYIASDAATPASTIGRRRIRRLGQRHANCDQLSTLSDTYALEEKSVDSMSKAGTMLYSVTVNEKERLRREVLHRRDQRHVTGDDTSVNVARFKLDENDSDLHLPVDESGGDRAPKKTTSDSDPSDTQPATPKPAPKAARWKRIRHLTLSTAAKITSAASLASARSRRATPHSRKRSATVALPEIDREPTRKKALSSVQEECSAGLDSHVPVLPSKENHPATNEIAEGSTGTGTAAVISEQDSASLDVPTDERERSALKRTCDKDDSLMRIKQECDTVVKTELPHTVDDDEYPSIVDDSASQAISRHDDVVKMAETAAVAVAVKFAQHRMGLLTHDQWTLLSASVSRQYLHRLSRSNIPRLSNMRDKRSNEGFEVVRVSKGMRFSSALYCPSTIPNTGSVASYCCRHQDGAWMRHFLVPSTEDGGRMSAIIAGSAEQTMPRGSSDDEYVMVEPEDSRQQQPSHQRKRMYAFRPLHLMSKMKRAISSSKKSVDRTAVRHTDDASDEVKPVSLSVSKSKKHTKFQSRIPSYSTKSETAKSDV